MPLYYERNDKTVLDFAVDPEGAHLFISKVNGDPALVGVPIVLSIGGTVTISADGTAVYDDQGLPALSEGDNRQDSVLVSISDGLNEVETTVGMEIFGATPGGTAVVEFGASTRKGAGGFPVTSAMIVGGDPSGHFEIVNGNLVVSDFGQGNLEQTYLLSFDTGEALLVKIIPDRFDVRSVTELQAAATAAEAIGATDAYEIVIRDGAILGDATEPVRIAGVQMTTSVDNPNASNFPETRNSDARVTLSGGSIRIRPETPGGAVIAGQMEIVGCDGIWLQNLIFSAAAEPTSPLSYYLSSQDNYGSSAETLAQLRILDGDQAQTSQAGTVLVETCAFETPGDRLSGHWGTGVAAEGVARLIVQDSNFTRLRQGIQTSGLTCSDLLRNQFKDILFDAVFHAPMNSGAERLEVVGNTVLGFAEEINFVGRQAAGIRLNGTAASGILDILVQDNYIFGALAGRQSAGLVSAFSGGTQLEGRILYNFVLANSQDGIVIDAGNFVSVTNNTLVPDTISDPVTGVKSALRITEGGTGIIARSNVVQQILPETGAGLTSLDNYTDLDEDIASGAGSFDEVFIGSFSFQNGRGPQFSVDTAGDAVLRADINNLFDSSADGPAAGIGFRQIVRPDIIGSPEVGAELTVADIDPNSTYQWRRNGSPISGADGANYTLVAADDDALITVIRILNGQFAVSASIHIGAHFKISGTEMIAPDGSVFLAKGFNVWADHIDYRTWETQNINYAGGIAALVDGWGINMLRLNVRYQSANDVRLPLPGQGAYLDVDLTVATYTNRGVVCLLDFHGSTYPNDPTPAEQAEALAWLEAKAEQYKDNPYVWFQPYNERGAPSGVPNATWIQYHRDAIEVIRATGNRNPILCCAGNYGQDVASVQNGLNLAESTILSYGSNLASDYANVGFDIHWYSRWAEADSEMISTYFDAVHAADLFIIVGEIGGEPTTDAGRSTYWADYYAAERFFAAGVDDVGFLFWHAGMGFDMCMGNDGFAGISNDATRISSLTEPDNLSQLGRLAWKEITGVDFGPRPPRLSNIGMTLNSDGTRRVQVTTNADEGTIYIVAQRSAKRPTVSNLKSGQGIIASVTYYAENQEVSGAGTYVFTMPASINDTDADHYLVLHEVPEPVADWTNTGSDMYLLPFSDTAAEAGTVTIEDFAFDKIVFDSRAAFGGSTASVTLRGTAPDGAIIEARRKAAGGAYVVIATTAADGTWEGTLDVAPDGAYDHVQVRIQEQTDFVETANRFAAGHVWGIMGQSQMEHGVSPSFAGVYPTPPTIIDADAVTFMLVDKAQDAPTPYPVKHGHGEWTPYMTFLANRFATLHPGQKAMVFDFMENGSSFLHMCSNGTGRDWSRAEAVRDYCDATGCGLSLVSWTWEDADLGALRGGRILDSYAPRMFGQYANGTTYPLGTVHTGAVSSDARISVDHCLWDFDASADQRGRGLWARDEVRMIFSSTGHLPSSGGQYKELQDFYTFTDGTNALTATWWEEVIEGWDQIFLADARAQEIGLKGIDSTICEYGDRLDLMSFSDYLHHNKGTYFGQALVYELIALNLLDGAGLTSLPHPAFSRAEIVSDNLIRLYVDMGGAGHELTTYAAREGLGAPEAASHRGAVAGIAIQAVATPNATITDSGSGGEGIIEVTGSGFSGLDPSDIGFAIGGGTGMYGPSDVDAGYAQWSLVVYPSGVSTPVSVQHKPVFDAITGDNIHHG